MKTAIASVLASAHLDVAAIIVARIPYGHADQPIC
jgi:hypothetical protein